MTTSNPRCRICGTSLTDHPDDLCTPGGLRAVITQLLWSVWITRYWRKTP